MNQLSNYNIPELYKTVKLKFYEEEHKYLDTMGNQYTSCTTLLHKFEPHVDYEYWAKKKAKELGISVKEIKNRWKTITQVSCDRGNTTHNALEDAVREYSMFKKAIKYLEPGDNELFTVADLDLLTPIIKPLDIDMFIKATHNKYPEIYRVFDYYIKLGYTIYSEIGVFLPDHLVSGLIDILCIRPTDFVILDWKTNKDGLNFKSGYYVKDKTCKPVQLTDKWVDKDDRLLPPVNHLPACNGSIYTLQLSMYAAMVHLITGLPCMGLGLCHIGTPFVLNKYGKPYKDENGLYIVDESKSEIVNWYRITNRMKECFTILKDHKMMIECERKTQCKLF